MTRQDERSILSEMFLSYTVSENPFIKSALTAFAAKEIELTGDSYDMVIRLINNGLSDMFKDPERLTIENIKIAEINLILIIGAIISEAEKQGKKYIDDDVFTEVFRWWCLWPWCDPLKRKKSQSLNFGHSLNFDFNSESVDLDL